MKFLWLYYTNSYLISYMSPSIFFIFQIPSFIAICNEAMRNLVMRGKTSLLGHVILF